MSCRWPRLAGLVSLLAAAEAAAQDDERAIRTVDDLVSACADAREPGRRALLSVDLDARSYRLGRYVEATGLLRIDTRRNLRTLGGSAELFPARMEPIGFVTRPGDVAAMRSSAAAGARLRVGFFLGFDDHRRSLCLVRRGAGVTTVRMDVAYLELVASDGSILARSDTERLRAWRDDAEAEALPGTGARAGIDPITVLEGAPALPRSWGAALADAARGTVGAALARCHAAASARGGAEQGRVWVRVEIDPRTGSLRSADVELSDLGDEAEERCIASALEGLVLPAAPDARGPIRMTLPIRLAR